MPNSYCDYHFPKTVTRWDEAIPLGNGHMGALIWGEAQNLRLSLDGADIWDCTPFSGVSDPEFTYANMTRLAREGNAAEIRRIFDAPYNTPTPTKLPAGALILHLPQAPNVESRLTLKDATAAITAGTTRFDAFLHAEKKVGLLKINLPQLDYTIEHPAYGSTEESEQHFNNTWEIGIKSLRYPTVQCFRDGTAQWFIQKTASDFAYGVFAKTKKEGESTLLAFTVAGSNDGECWSENALALLDETLEQGYEAAHARHEQWWADFWGKSELSLPDKLFEANWYRTNYLLASCSRKGGYPMPLQGVWTADDGNLPPWKGDYHHDLNTQLSYSHYLKANHLPEGESFLDYLWDMVPMGRKFAKSFYGTDGMCLPAVMSIDGQALGGWGMYALSPTNQIWLCQIFDRHYRYTASETFLKDRCLPYLTETAVCISQLLEEKDGKLYLPWSSSPEIHDDNIESFLTPNSNYDLALMRWLFGRLVQLTGESRWQKILDKLPQLAIREDGILLLSPDEAIVETHRHHSNLMAIRPLNLIGYETEEDQKIVDANLADLELRGPGLWCGYSYAWASEFYSTAHNGNGAARALRIFWEDFCSQNTFHLNGDYKNSGSSMLHYRPFTLEGNMQAASSLQEMLLQSRNGKIELFPAIPDAWKDQKISFKNFRAEGGKLVSAEYDCGKITVTVVTE